jgi:OmpA-OmpF porin, OOP family
MRHISKRRAAAALVCLAGLSLAPAQAAQEDGEGDRNIVVTAPKLAKGPEIKGIISARNGERIRIIAGDGSVQDVSVNDATRISSGSGLFGGGNKLAPGALLNGLPVTVRTLQSDSGLVASHIRFRSSDLKTATMIRTGTSQQFAEQSAATEALRGRMGDIDQYNIKRTANVFFDTGKAQLTPEAKRELCAVANEAAATDNALMLVVGYADARGSEEFNQILSEKRAGSVINHLQQACRWKPYRMLTPTGMAEADPLADNDTPEGQAQNRRVAVNVLVSKAIDGL